MRYVKFDPENAKMLVDRSIKDRSDLADVLSNAGYDDWLEGLGQPMTTYDLTVWRAMGKFLNSQLVIGLW